MTSNRPDFTTRLLIDAGIAEGMRVLDVGCGSGDVSFLLADLVGKDGEIIGVDHDARAVAIARERGAAKAHPALTFVLASRRHRGLSRTRYDDGTGEPGAFPAA